ncbi:hypothetical protein DFH27DRAFT_542025 [Peziza echinospora]|nr:hypothetical protein DFH27DRAFT_542025 [Peziza echinospora]
MATTSSPAEMAQTPFLKQLAANDRPTRDAAVSALRTYLGGKRVFSKVELLKLWKGLFYCMWMSDRPRTQQRLAMDLAGLVTTMRTHTAITFLECFWETIAREWNGIDVLRMDKFLLLVRAYLASSFRYLREREWAQDLVAQYMEILKNIPLHPTENRIPNGIRYHLIDIYVDELEKLEPATTTPTTTKDESEEESEEEEEETSDTTTLPIDQLLEPFEVLLEKASTKVVRTRTRELLSDERLVKWGYSKAVPAKPGHMEIDEEEEWGGFA